MENKVQVLIVGGGLAGLTNALHLLKLGFSVTLVEKNKYPKHKVCGEYISNEVLPYLSWLDADPIDLKPTKITKFQYSSNQGITCSCTLPLGGFGLSRYTLDYFLYQRGKMQGLIVLEDTVTDISFINEEFCVSTINNGLIAAEIVVAAYGKRAILDQKLSRSFIQKKSPWLAIKAHYKGSFSNELVALHSFLGGYCGVSKVEDDKINICYLVDYQSFKLHRNPDDHREKVLYQNPFLKEIFQQSERIMDIPLSIGQICFDKRKTVENHILMIGDTAGLIHPLCGNGIAIAMRSAKICAESIAGFINGDSKSRMQMEADYEQKWNSNFKRRVQVGRSLARVLTERKLIEPAIKVLANFPFLLPFIIRQTHGQPMQI